MAELYPEIEDHGLIGDWQTCALVTTGGTIDWFCAPRFDSPSVFASLLDADKGGYFRIAPTTEATTTKQLYFPDTGVLITRFMSEAGVAEIHDFMPISQPHQATDRHSIVRMVKVPRGEVELRLELAPRFDYGRSPHTAEATEHGIVFSSGSSTMTLHVWSPVELHDGDAVGTFTLKAGETGGFVLEWASGEQPHHVSTTELEGCFVETVAAWKRWLSSSTYQGRWRDMVNRSAITLKMLSYAPTGAPVAAATTGLPEQVGGERNWDYRYTWLRDASLTVQALYRLGFSADAYQFLAWLRDRVELTPPDANGPLRIMYRVDGTADLDEFALEHFEGYKRSAPVRIGNGASSQVQLDTYGEMLDAIWHAERTEPVLGRRGWKDLSGIVDWVADNWDQPEEGIWETRGGRKAFVYGRIMCWVALDRGIRMATATGTRPAPLEKWMAARDAINEQIVTEGWNADIEALVQHYGSDVLDASLLAALRLHYLVPLDELWWRTLDAIESKLVSDSLVYRYDPEASPDGLQGTEGTFSMCTFWYVDALTRSNRLADARLVFEKMLTYANHLGLYAEEIGQNGEQLGNFPQAFTHLSLINAAIDLDAALDQQVATFPDALRQ